MSSNATVRVLALAPAKLNLFLLVQGKRGGDGYHLIDSLLVAISLFDRIEIGVSASDEQTGCVQVRCESALGVPTVDSSEANLVSRAASAVLHEVSQSRRVDIFLRKCLPIGAGLGGGSADAAATLLGLNAALGKPLSDTALQRLALRLGADVPYCLASAAARVTGVGEAVTPQPFRPGLNAVICWPGQSVATARVFAEYDKMLTNKLPTSSIDRIFRIPFHQRIEFINELEPAAQSICPAISRTKDRLRTLGAKETAMSGSGSGVFGAFDDVVNARAAASALRAQGLWAESVQVVGCGMRIERIDGR